MPLADAARLMLRGTPALRQAQRPAAVAEALAGEAPAPANPRLELTGAGIATGSEAPLAEVVLGGLLSSTALWDAPSGAGSLR